MNNDFFFEKFDLGTYKSRSRKLLDRTGNVIIIIIIALAIYLVYLGV